MATRRWLAGLIMAAWFFPVAAYGAAAFTFDYTFKAESEPDGFRGIKWQQALSTLNPFNTMDLLELVGPNASYRKYSENLTLGSAKLQTITYEFWNGKFAGVVIKVKGPEDYRKLREYCFNQYGPGKRSQVYASMDVQDFVWNGYLTKMYLRYSDMDRMGELGLYSIAILNKKQRADNLFQKELDKSLFKEWEKPKGK